MSFRTSKERLVGPFVAVPCLGGWRVLDMGNGAPILKAHFKTERAAWDWLNRNGLRVVPTKKEFA